MTENNQEYQLLPHHEQLSLCTTRLPYRQGRKLTAVKVYSINYESKHLLIFGVPSLNLRQEAKSLFLRFGKLSLFSITKYPAEMFTETYHAVYEDIQSARVAKKMLDTKNFYGGNLHICYAPELESVDETRQKLLHRYRNVIARLKNLEKESVIVPKASVDNETNQLKEVDQQIFENKPLYMGDVNEIKLDNDSQTETIGRWDSNFTKMRQPKLKRLKPKKNLKKEKETTRSKDKSMKPSKDIEESTSSCEIIDFSSASTEVLTNINESLNYNNFGKEVIKTVPYKPLNKVKFALNKKS